MKAGFRLADIHVHLLPNVDDGAAGSRMTKEMLHRAYGEGVRKMIVTPHFRGGMFETPAGIIRKRFDKVREYAREIGEEGIELYLGCEYFRETDMADRLKQGVRPTLAGSAYVLVEFSHWDSYSRIRNVLYELRCEGYLPVIAHAERYDAFAGDPENVSDAIRMGAYIQVNVDSVLGKAGRKAKAFCRTLMNRKEIHFIASDAHDMTERISEIGRCALYVEKKWGSRTAKKIFWENPEMILENKNQGDNYE